MYFDHVSGFTLFTIRASTPACKPASFKVVLQRKPMANGIFTCALQIKEKRRQPTQKDPESQPGLEQVRLPVKVLIRANLLSSVAPSITVSKRR